MKCAICGKEITRVGIKNYLGNNPFPVRLAEDARCCDDCNNDFILPARIYLMDKPVEPFAKKLDSMSYEQLLDIFC